MNEQDIDIMREWIKSGLIIDDAVAECLVENIYETEESYRSKLERLSEHLMER